MPDTQTASLRSIQNPLHRHLPVPCIQDQHRLIAGSNYKTADTRKQTAAYQKKAIEHSRNLQEMDSFNCTKDEKPSADKFGKYNPTDWEMKTYDRFQSSATCEYQPEVSFGKKDWDWRHTENCHTNCNKLAIMKTGRYYHYLDPNSAHCTSDISKDFRNED